MKTFKELINQLDEVAEPRPGKRPPKEEKYEDGGKSDEGRFKDKHVIAKKDHPVAKDSQFKGTVEKKKRLADVEKGKDAEMYEEKFSSILVQRAVKIAERKGGDMTHAVREIEKLKKGLSKESSVAQALRLANEETDWETDLIESILAEDDATLLSEDIDD